MNQESELNKILTTDISNKNAQINDLKRQCLNLEIEHEKAKSSSYKSNFNLNLYWPIFIAASIFLYGFYLSAFHTAFFRDINKFALGFLIKSGQNLVKI